MADLHFAHHRGTITGLAASGPRVLYVTRHPEGQATALAVFDVATAKTSRTELGASATALTLIGKTAYVACTDGTVYSVLPATPPAPFASVGAVAAMTPVAGGIAIAAGDGLVIHDLGGDEVASFDLGEPVSALAASPDGAWLTAGTRRGRVAVYQLDGTWSQAPRQAPEAARLHDGEVTALAFAPDELRVYSTGTDARVLVSYVRGSFDTEDRGANNSHERPIRALLHGPDFSTADGVVKRFYTASDDSTLKSWPRGRSGSQRPSTFADGVVQSTHLACVTVDDQPRLVVAGQDATLRVFGFDEEGRVDEHLATLYDGYRHAENLLEDERPERRKLGLEMLAQFGDEAAVVQLADHLCDYEPDHKLSVLGVRLLAQIDHADVADALERFFDADASDVRVAAFDGLARHRGPADRDTLDMALHSGFDDLGLRAVAAAEESATDEGVEVLTAALDNPNQNVRVAALQALERHFGDDPRGTLLGLDSALEETRRRALVHLHRRGLLEQPRVAARIRRTFDDPEYRVRQTAFHVATLRRKNLVKALRRKDSQYHRQIFELEEFGKSEKERRQELPPAPALNLSRLSEDDLKPLLEATASRDIEVALLGARGLAVIGDERALGTLLQLSREPQTHARANAAIAMQALDDRRSLHRVRMMLRDPQKQVRDAAFSALESLQSDDPFATVSAGLAAAALDTRERALGLLAKTLTSTGGELKGDFEGRELLLRALQDVEPSLRLEAFKNALNLQVDGGGADTLRFIRRSHHADVRAQTLEEARANPRDDGYKAYLLELLDDSDRSIWLGALDFARDRWASDEHRRIFEKAVSARTPQARIHAVGELARERSAELRAILATPLDDEKPEVRLAAVRALVTADMRGLLTEALQSSWSDVRIEAASALASLGDERALDGLLGIVGDYRTKVTEAAPAHEVEALEDRVLSALGGIGDLGHARALDEVVALIGTARNAAVLQGAARTIPWLTRPQTLEDVRPLLEHEDSTVRQQAALALAYQGDPTVDAHIFGQLGTSTELVAAFALRDTTPDRFLAYVDGGGSFGDHALSIVLLLELSELDGIPERCVSLLSANDPRVRLRAGQAIEHFGERAGFYGWVYKTVNELRKTGEKHEVPAKTLLSLSRAMVHGAPLVAVRAAQLLGLLQQGDGQAFDQGWEVFSDRLADELERLDRRANTGAPDGTGSDAAKPKTGGLAAAWSKIKETVGDLVAGAATLEDALASLAFGAYVGLTRETGGSAPHLVRASAISGLLRLSRGSERFAGDVANILLVALGDPAQNVRERAFDGLLELDVDHDVVSAEALSTDYGDMGFRGLELLASGGGNDLLIRTLLDATNGLEEQAARLLVDRVGELEVHKLGVAAASQPFRRRSVLGLARTYDSEPTAADALRLATSSRHRDVRLAAALELASRKDPAAFEPLTEFVPTTDYGEYTQVARSFELLADPRAADLLLDQIEHHPNADSQTTYFDTIVSLGDTQSATSEAADVSLGDTHSGRRLLDFIDRDLVRNAAADAAFRLTGYQQLSGVDDDDVTAEWLAQRSPLYPDYFAELFALAYRIASPEILGSLVGSAKWPEHNESIDETLAALLSFSDEHVRHRAVEMVGWRLSHREGPHQGLVSLLESSDPLGQFYAAEGLALAGHDDGLAVLRTAVDAMADWGLRERAILALGRLANPATLDMLLELASDDTNYLQSAAAEAIGHMARTDRADEIFAILKQLATAGGTAQTSAFKGLRWFGTPAAWGVLRRQAQHEHWWIAQEAVALLKFDDDSRDLLAEILRTTDDWDVANTAAEALRHIYGAESLEPDYFIVQAEQSEFDAAEETLERLYDRGEVGRILEILPKIHEDNRSLYYEPLVDALLTRKPLPVAEALPMLDSDNGGTASVAARIVGRAGAEASEHAGKVVAATARARAEWGDAYEAMLANRRGAKERLEDATLRYRWLVWTCSQLEAGREEIAKAGDLPVHEASRPMRESALATFGDPWFGQSGVDLLVAKATSSDVRTRALATSELERAAPGRAGEFLARVAHDDVSVGRLARGADAEQAKSSLRGAVEDPATARIALPQLARMCDTTGLFSAMQNDALDEGVRRGAIDALASIGSAEVAEMLARFGADEAHDEGLRKAAWRARRRVNRST